jgi:hypothetical protein
VAVVAPEEPGVYVLELGLVLEDVRWFGETSLVYVVVS